MCTGLRPTTLNAESTVIALEQHPATASSYTRTSKNQLLDHATRRGRIIDIHQSITNVLACVDRPWRTKMSCSEDLLHPQTNLLQPGNCAGQLLTQLSGNLCCRRTVCNYPATCAAERNYPATCAAEKRKSQTIIDTTTQHIAGLMCTGRLRPTAPP